LNLTVGKVPDGPRYGIIVRNSVEIHVFEGLRHRPASLWVVAIGHDLGTIDVDVEVAGEIVVDCDVGGEVELRVQCASTVAGLDGSRGGKFVDVCSARGRAVQALLDAVAFVLDRGEGQINFRHDAGHVEAPGVSDAAFVHGWQVRADALEASFIVMIVVLVVVIIASTKRAGDDAGSEDGC